MLIVGGGPAGLSAAIYASRARMSVLVIEAMLSGGQIATTERLENYPGFPEGIGGAEFGQLLEAQARRFGTEMVLATVTGVSSEGEIKTVQTSNGTYRGRTLLIASGDPAPCLGCSGRGRIQRQRCFLLRHM